jgi:hypothetical protein
MVTVKFPNKKYTEKGLRTIVTSGTVEYTASRGVYRIPNYVADILDEERIRFTRVDGKARKKPPG